MGGAWRLADVRRGGAKQPLATVKTYTKPGLLTLLYIYAVSFRYLDLTFVRGSIYVTILRCLEIYISRTAVSVN